MFKDTRAFSSFSADDIPRVGAFYRDVLGLEVTEDNGLLNVQIAGSSAVLIYPKLNHIAATFTVLNFPVDNIEQVMDALTQRGVRFEHYDGEVQTDERGLFVVESMDVRQAWFKDPAGNILSVIESS